MKRFVISALSVLALSSLATPVVASEVVAVNSSTKNEIGQITPFSLVSGSYQGRFETQGIPSAGSLVRTVNTNQIGAKDLVEGAIASGRLSEATLSDRGYLNSVDSLLNNLHSN